MNGEAVRCLSDRLSHRVLPTDRDGAVRIPVVIPVRVQEHQPIVAIEVRDRHVPPRIVAGNRRVRAPFRTLANGRTRRHDRVLRDAWRSHPVPRSAHGVLERSLGVLRSSVDDRTRAALCDVSEDSVAVIRKQRSMHLVPLLVAYCTNRKHPGIQGPKPKHSRVPMVRVPRTARTPDGPGRRSADPGSHPSTRAGTPAERRERSPRSARPAADRGREPRP